jgi:hypothetical protein
VLDVAKRTLAKGIGAACLLGLTSAVASLGCERHEAYGLSRDGTVTVQGAVDRLSSAECARAQRCEHIGAMAAFKSDSSCLALMRPDHERELAGGRCPAGVRAEALDRCVRLTESEGCDDLSATVKRIEACRASQLCPNR